MVIIHWKKWLYHWNPKLHFFSHPKWQRIECFCKNPLVFPFLLTHVHPSIFSFVSPAPPLLSLFTPRKMQGLVPKLHVKHNNKKTMAQCQAWPSVTSNTLQARHRALSQGQNTIHIPAQLSLHRQSCHLSEHRVLFQRVFCLFTN